MSQAEKQCLLCLEHGLPSSSPQTQSHRHPLCGQQYAVGFFPPRFLIIVTITALLVRQLQTGSNGPEGPVPETMVKQRLISVLGGMRERGIAEILFKLKGNIPWLTL